MAEKSGDEKSAEPVTVDWTEAMNQVGGDVEFLREVLQDLLDEADTAEEDIKAGIEKKDYEKIMKAAHRIKGSATYLGCEAMRLSSYHLQLLGHDGISQSDSEELLKNIKDEFHKFQRCFNDLRNEIAKWQEEQS